MIAVILFQINVLAFAVVTLCSGKKRPYDGDRDVDLVQAKPGSGSGAAPPPAAAVKPPADDFSLGVPPPHVPLADKSDDRTLADIESIQSEKIMMRDKKNKVLSKAKGTSGSQSPASGTPVTPTASKTATSPAVPVDGPLVKS